MRLSVPARDEPLGDAAIERLVRTCVLTLLDPHDTARASRILEREQPGDVGEAIESLCDWTVRRERSRLRRVGAA